MHQSIASINNLLGHVKQVYKKHDDINQLTGRNFNVFELLEVTTNEVRLHSKFIANLLNPKGSHGQGIKYLELFQQILNKKIKELNLQSELSNIYSELDLDFASVKTDVELSVGKKNRY